MKQEASATDERRPTTVRLTVDTMEWLKIKALRGRTTMQTIIEQAVERMRAEEGR